MTRREVVHAAVGAVSGLLLASAAWSLQKPAAPAVKAEPTASDGGADDMDSLRRANANLVDSLHAADQTIAQLREQVGVPAPSARPTEARQDDLDAGRGRRRGRGGEPTTEDWERMAQLATVRVRVPCIRDKPWTPTPRVLDRLGLAPSDAATIREAYEHSNKRMADQITPLCVKALGSAEAASRVGPKACSDAILSGARRSDPDGTQKSLVRVAEINAGKQDAKPTPDGPGVEQLLLAMTKESKAFEAELASKLGPEEAKRIAYSPDLCSDRTTVRAKEDDPSDDAPQGGRGPRGGSGR